MTPAQTALLERIRARPGAASATMGPGRNMGPGWIEVAPEHLETALAHRRAANAEPSAGRMSREMMMTSRSLTRGYAGGHVVEFAVQGLDAS